MAIMRQSAAELAEQVTETMLPVPAATEHPLAIPSDPSALATWQRTVRDARLVVLSLVDRFTRELGTRRAAVEHVAALTAAGALPPAVADAVSRANARAGRDTAASLTASTLYRWVKARETGGADALAPAAQAMQAPPAWLPRLLAIYQHPGRPTVAQCVRRWPDVYPEIPPPAMRTAQRQVERIPVELREWGRMGKRQLRSVQPFVRRTTDGLWPMDVVTVDGHSFKAYVRHPASGRRIRPEITTYVDVATRKAVGFSLWVAESQYAIWLALRRMVLDPAQGVPAIQYSDNGAYRGDEHAGVLARLGTVPMFSEAYRAQARGLIERINSSIFVPLARTLPTFCGDGVDQELFKRALKRADDTGAGLPEWHDAIALVRDALARYNATPHSALRAGRSRLTPDQAWQGAIADGWKPTTLEGDDLHDLLPAVERKCQRGEVTLPWGRYFAEELRYAHTHEVRVAYDPADGARVWVSDSNGRLLAIAKRDGNATNYVPESALEHARAKRETERVRRLEKRIASARADETPVIEGQAFDLPDLPIHGVATVIQGQAEPVAMTDDQRRVHERIQREIHAERSPLDHLHTDPDRYTAWRQLADRRAAGEQLSVREAAFVDGFGASDYCRVMQQMEADFDAATGVSTRG